ncbi:MAG: HlyD family efflux transporter periplasmic adaptor subunit [Chlorobiaceae bacterium]|nr:HlyD family efflux transporter periplasmic adaptor subunit [Chlorobiaceae bacterium]
MQVNKNIGGSNNVNGSDAGVPIMKHADTRGPIRLGFWVLIVGFGAFLLWAAFAPLDEGVPCGGMVSISTKRKVVQHLHGGTVTGVGVHEGQTVRKGELLLELDSKASKARYAEVHQHYLGLRAAECRLLAEQRGESSIRPHKDLVSDPDRSLVDQLLRTQRELLDAHTTTIRLYREQLASLKDLVREGYAPLSQQRDIEIKIAQLRAESAAQLAQVQNEVQADSEKSIALAEELAETEVRSPSDGQVVGLQVQTVGAVIQPGQKVMDIVPLNESLIVEAKIPPHLIDKVHKGLVANVQFASFANSPQLVVSGRIETVSADLLTEMASSTGQGQQAQAPVQAYYLARIAITGEGMKTLGSRKLQPGMPVQVVIKTGERTMLDYILHPLMKRMTASLKEE